MGKRERSLGHKNISSVKEGDSKSALSQHQVMTGHKVLVIEGVNVIDRNMHRKVKETSTSSFEEPPSTEQEGMTYLAST